MKMHNYPDCNCQKTRHNYDYCIDHKNCSCSRCRKDICDTDFKIRLAGLQSGLNFRLSQQLWGKAEFELDNGSIVKGTIVFVGSNFVEVLVDESLPTEDGNEEEVEVVEAAEEDWDKELTQQPPIEKNEMDENEIRHHSKGRTWIFSMDKIANVRLSSSPH